MSDLVTCSTASPILTIDFDLITDLLGIKHLVVLDGRGETVE